MNVEMKKVRITSLHQEETDVVFNKVWEVTRMSWPEHFSEAVDRSKVKLIRADKRLSRNH
ncbi:MAG: hypothetical protein ACE5F3_06905 [Mariprofundaceae bacterium]